MKTKLKINTTMSELYTNEIEPIYDEIEANIKSKYDSSSAQFNYDMISLSFYRLSIKVLAFSDKFLESSDTVRESIENVDKFLRNNKDHLSPAFKEGMSGWITDSKYTLLKTIAEQQDKNAMNFSQKNKVEKLEIEEAVTNAVKPIITLFSNLFAELNSSFLKSAASQNKEIPKKPESNAMSFYNRTRSDHVKNSI